MKWSTVKNMLLGLLIVMNVFMVVITVVKRYNSEKIPPLARAAAVEALAGSGIECNEELIPDRYLSMKRYKAEFFTAAELSRMFFGEQLAFQTDGRTLIAQKDGAELRVEDNRFYYSSGSPAKEAENSDIKKALKAVGLDMGPAVDGGRGEFGCRAGGRTVFGMYIRASLDKDGGIAEIEAYWPKLRPYGGKETDISPIDCLPEIMSFFPDGGRVVSLEAGYRLINRENTGSSVMEPAWKIEMDDGASAVITD